MKTPKSANLMTTLQYLLDHVGLSSNALAKILNVPTPTVYRLTTGEVQDPRISTLTMLGDYFGVTIEQLLGKKSLDAHFYDKNAAKYIRPSSSIPLFTLQETYHFQKNSKEPTQWFHWKTALENASHNKLFSIAIKNNLYHPLFPQDTVLIVDAAMSPENGNYVVVNFKGNTISVLKRFISEGKNKYFTGVTMDTSPVKFDANETMIIGVIIESYKNFKNY